MVTHRLLASMAQRDRGEDRPDMLAVLRPLPPDPRGQDDDIQSHEDPIEERHRLQTFQAASREYVTLQAGLGRVGARWLGAICNDSLTPQTGILQAACRDAVLVPARTVWANSPPWT